jgi:hypothetical protein
MKLLRDAEGTAYPLDPMPNISTACRTIRFPITFDPGLLLRDLELCAQEPWNRHVNTSDYAGDWTSIALRSPSGDAGDIRTHSTGEFHPTPLAEACTYFTNVIDSFLCEKESVRLLRLAPRAVIHEHRDRARRRLRCGRRALANGKR